MIISVHAEKAFDKIQHPFMIKTLRKVGIEGNFLNLIKNIYKNPTANIILNDEKLKGFPLRSGSRQECLLLTLFFNNILEVPTMQDWFNTPKSINGIHYINKIKDTHFVIISKNAEKKHLKKSNTLS